VADVWLRQTRKYRGWILFGLGLMLAILELFAVRASIGGAPFALSGTIALVAWALLAPFYLYRLVPR